jgi:hypothetical protein
VPDAIATDTCVVLSLETTLPWASRISITGCVLNALPLEAPTGWVETARVVAVPGTDWNVPVDPVKPPSSVAVTVPDDTVPGVVKLTVASPVPSTVDVAGENVPPDKLDDQVMTAPAAGTALPFASESCAEIVTALPATGLVSELVTR